MKKASLIIAAILMAIIASGQVEGVDLDNALEVKTDDELQNHIEEWLQTPESNYVFFIVNDYATDYKHLISELDRILKANDLDINKPDMEDDLLPSEINGLRDYENLSYYVALGKAKIMRRYFIDDKWTIGITCNYQVRALILVKSQEQLNNPGRDAFGNQGDPNGTPDATDTIPGVDLVMASLLLV